MGTEGRADSEQKERRRRGFLVAPARFTKILDFSHAVRAAFGFRDQAFFPIIDVIEYEVGNIIPSFVFDVRSKEEMGADEGLTIPALNTLILREDVYEAACMNQGRARFTAAHELGHLLMHRSVALARSGQVTSIGHPIYSDSEWQADVFAGTLLMSKYHLHQFRSVHDAAEKCGLSFSAASRLLELLGGIPRTKMG